jgi:hypothetical protein
MDRQHGEVMQVTVSANFTGLQRKLDQLSGSLQQRVAPAALNKVGPKARTAMVRQITSEFNIRQDEVRSRLRLKKATRGADDWFVILDPFASRRRKGTSINLIRFVEKSVTLAEAKRRKKTGTVNQLYFKIKKRGKRVTLSGAFIATNKRTGGTAVFTRVGKERLPIQPKQTIDIPQMFNTKRIQAEVIKVIERELPIEFNRAIKAAAAGVFR